MKILPFLNGTFEEKTPVKSILTGVEIVRFLKAWEDVQSIRVRSTQGQRTFQKQVWKQTRKWATSQSGTFKKKPGKERPSEQRLCDQCAARRRWGSSRSKQRALTFPLVHCGYHNAECSRFLRRARHHPQESLAMDVVRPASYKDKTLQKVGSRPARSASVVTSVHLDTPQNEEVQASHLASK